MQPLIRALSVLKILADHPEGMSLSGLSHELEVPQGSMHRLLAVLEGEAFISRSPSNRRFFLGPAARQLNNDNSRHHALLMPAHPALADAAARSGETVFLTELVGDRAVCVSLVESTHPLRMFVRIGQEMPLHAAASARTLLADLPPEQARRLLASRELSAFTAGTVTDPDELIDMLTLIRARGYDVCDDELDRGVWAISSPVRASTGRVIASVTLAGPSHRITEPHHRDRYRRIVSDAAHAMSADLGWVEPEVREVGTVSGDTSGRRRIAARKSAALTRPSNDKEL
jgi:IclR family acetate operon transcriptional repressor